MPPESPYKITDEPGINEPPPARVISNADDDKYEEGYDSEGEIGPFFDAVADEIEANVEVEDEDAGLPTTMGGDGTNAAPAEGDKADWYVAKGDVIKLKMEDLKAEIRRRGVVPKGKKGDLQNMLRECVAKRLPIVEGGPDKNAAALGGFPVGSKWKMLVPLSDLVPEPVNEFAFRPPTLGEGESPTTPKQNFQERFDRPVFQGKDSKGNVRLKGEPRARFLRDEGLTVNSHPEDWADAFFPRHESKRRTSLTPHHLSVEKLCRWSNEKAALLEMGTPSKYPDFTNFTTEEFEQYMFLPFWNGLCTSPSVEKKLQTEEESPIHSNAALRRALGPNAARRFREWKCCFSLQDPKLPVPSRKTHPNFKLDEFNRHLLKIWRYAWRLKRDLAGDEQTMGFKGQHVDKLRITYKDEGDGFQCDAICDDGYTYTFFFRNQPAPKKYLDEGFSPLHARVMALYDSLQDDFHRVRFDNLYMAAKFALASFQHQRRVMVEGVTRTHARGLCNEVVQMEVKGKERINAVKGTVKAAVLEDCAPLASCPLVAASVYDTKPVHFLSMCCEEIKWIEKTRQTWDKSTSCMRLGRFLRLCINDSYNLNMGDVDVSDQLRGSYRPDAKWTRKHKWWHAIYYWGKGTDLVNAYVSYKRFMEMNGKKPMSHYKFREKIVLAKVCPREHASPKRRGRTVAAARGDQ